MPPRLPIPNGSSHSAVVRRAQANNSKTGLWVAMGILCFLLVSLGAGLFFYIRRRRSSKHGAAQQYYAHLNNKAFPRIGKRSHAKELDMQRETMIQKSLAARSSMTSSVMSIMESSRYSGVPHRDWDDEDAMEKLDLNDDEKKAYNNQARGRVQPQPMGLTEGWKEFETGPSRERSSSAGLYPCIAASDEKQERMSPPRSRSASMLQAPYLPPTLSPGHHFYYDRPATPPLELHPALTGNKKEPHGLANLRPAYGTRM